MLQKRKWLALALAGALSLSMLAGCTETQAPVPSASSPAPSSADANPDVPAPDTSGDESAAGTGNVLVVYFSASGNTEAVANYIAEAAGGDLFEITPADPYTEEDLNWTDEDSRVVFEYENPEERDTELAAYTPDGWDGYDVVFIGYPIWWYDAAWRWRALWRKMTLQARRSSPSAPPPVPDWVRAAAGWLIWPAPATGRRDSGSVPAPPSLI